MRKLDTHRSPAEIVARRRPRGGGGGWIRGVAALIALGLAACGKDVTAPPEKQVYQLVAVNGIPIPAIAVEGTCRVPSFWDASVYPDSIRIDGGALTLEEDRYELFYTWRGETDACTTSHALWHRFSGGTYSVADDRLFFTEGSVSDTVAGWRGGSPGAPAGRRTGSHNVVVSWGALTLEYANW